QDRNLGGRLRNVAAAVTDLFAWGNVSHLQHPSLPGKGWLQRKRLWYLGLGSGSQRQTIAIDCKARPDQVEPGPLAAGDGGAVGHVADGRLESVSLSLPHRFSKLAELLFAVGQIDYL